MQPRNLCPHGGSGVEPTETVADLPLDVGVVAPHLEAVRPQRFRKSTMHQFAAGFLECRTNRSWFDCEGHRATMRLKTMGRILRSLLLLLPLAVAACAQPEEPEVSAATRLAPAPAEQVATAPRARIVFLGDSLTAGLGLPRDEAVPSLIQSRLDGEGYLYEVVNAGVSGDTSAGGLRRLDWALEGNVDVLVVELGANDGLRGLPVAQMKQNLDQIVSRAKERNITVILTGMEAPPNYGPAYTSEFRKAFREVADKHGVIFVPFFLEGVAGIASLNNSDGIHPNAAGARIIEGMIWRVLEPVLERPAADTQRRGGDPSAVKANQGR
jgi:acyl-CoA thioesterase-1